MSQDTHSRSRVRELSRSWICVLSGALLALPAAAQTGTNLTQGSNAANAQACTNFDGTIVAFASEANNLVAGTTQPNVYHRDPTGVLTRVARGPLGVEPDARSDSPAISGDGRYVAFRSEAANLIPGINSGQSNIYLYDVQGNTTTLISIRYGGGEANGPSTSPAISSDGRFVAFYSSATDLVLNNANPYVDAYVYDTQTSTAYRASESSASVEGNWHSSPRYYLGSSDIAVEGLGGEEDLQIWVAFHSEADNLDPSDINGAIDVYAKEVISGALYRMNVIASGVDPLLGSFAPDISQLVASSGGPYVAFLSQSNNLVVGDTNGYSEDVFRWDVLGGTVQRVNLGPGGVQGTPPPVPNPPPVYPLSFAPSISFDGNVVTFDSLLLGLTDYETNGATDVLRHDIPTVKTSRVSEPQTAGNGNDHSWGNSISGNGLMAVFQSFATNFCISDTNGFADIFETTADQFYAAFCFGDGSGSVACPCGNTGLPRRGCDNTASSGGAELLAFGTASLSADSLHLVTREVSPSTSAFFFQSSSFPLNPIAHGDGLRCTGTGLVSLGSKLVNSSGYVAYGPSLGDIPIHLKGGSPPPVGSQRYYQMAYRVVSPICGTVDYNWSNAVTVSWGL